VLTTDTYLPLDLYHISYHCGVVSKASRMKNPLILKSTLSVEPSLIDILPESKLVIIFVIIFDCNARQAILGFCPFLAILVCVRLAVADNF
jgi:hypothetical protein